MTVSNHLLDYAVPLETFNYNVKPNGLENSGKRTMVCMEFISKWVVWTFIRSKATVLLFWVIYDLTDRAKAVLIGLVKTAATFQSWFQERLFWIYPLQHAKKRENLIEANCLFVRKKSLDISKTPPSSAYHMSTYDFLNGYWVESVSDLNYRKVM